jgi:hypothetical protein
VPSFAHQFCATLTAVVSHDNAPGNECGKSLSEFADSNHRARSTAEQRHELITGLQSCQQLRDSTSGRIPVILYAGDPPADSPGLCDRVLSKSGDVRVLVDAIRALLQRNRQGVRSSVHSPIPCFTVGHSNRSLEQFLELLSATEIRLVVDVRAIPRCRAHPQFNQDTLSQALAASRIGYEHINGLGGRRSRVRSVTPEVNGFWTNQSFHNYADYALSVDYRVALDSLIRMGGERRCVMMCSEAVWWRCYRRIIMDHLIAPRVGPPQ